MIITLIKMLIAIVIGIVYIPLNLLLLKTSELYQKMDRGNPWYWVVRIGIFPLWLVVSILSAPYDMMVESVH